MDAEGVDGRIDELRDVVLDAVPIERAREVGEEEHGAEETEIADAIGDERLLAGRSVGVLLVPEADEEVRAEPDALPPDEEHRQVVGHHEDEHREDEEVQVAEEPVEALVLRHVRRGVEVDERADARDDEHHHRAERVDAELHVDGDAATTPPTVRVHPLPERPGDADVVVDGLAVFLMPVASTECASASRTTTEQTKLTTIVVTAITRTAGLPSRLPQMPFTSAPSSGIPRMTPKQREVVLREQDREEGHSSSSGGSASSRAHGTLDTEQRDDDGKADGDLGSLGGDEEEREELTRAGVRSRRG